MRHFLILSYLSAGLIACSNPASTTNKQDIIAPTDTNPVDGPADILETPDISDAASPSEDTSQIQDTSTPPDTAPDKEVALGTDTLPSDTTQADVSAGADIFESPDGMEDPAADDDEDGLPNAQEAMAGTDPLDPDSDDDGYLDGHEVIEGTDPLDPESRIYQGNWPYNPNKDAIESPSWDKCINGECIGFGSCNPADADDDTSDWQEPTGCSLKNGLKLPRWIAKDQYGDMVDLYDFIGTGKPVVLDVGTPYCKPCKALAAYFATGDPNHTTIHSPEPLTSFAWWKPEYEVLLDMINNDEIQWITVIWSSCVGGNPVDENAGKAWHDEWPHDKIPALVDPECQLKDYLNVKAMPHLDVLDSDMVFTTYATNGPVAAIKALLEL